VTSNDAGRLAAGEAQRSALTTPAGTCLDDLLVLRLAARHFLLVTNAAASNRDVAAIVEHAKAFDDAAVVDTSSRYALLALQGPAAPEVLQELTSVDVAALEPWWFTHTEVAGVRATVANVGWAGESGYHLLAPPPLAARLWDALLDAGSAAGVVPAGLEARDTLRLEAAWRAHGREIDETATLIEAGLEALIGWEKGEFVGRDALLAERSRGPARRLVGFEVADAGSALPVAGSTASLGGGGTMRVTSAARTPSVQRVIGLAYVRGDRAAPGTEFDVDVEGRRVGLRVVPLPFYKRPKG
jgi:aminomethyltransferase